MPLGKKMKAKIIAYISISYYIELPDGVFVAETSCPSQEYFEELPEAIEFKEKKLGKSGWNSDIGRAYFRSDVKLAKIVHEYKPLGE